MSKTILLLAAISLVCIGSGIVAAADKAPKKLTCCEEAAAKGKECAHKCCITAHQRNESCAKCNPGKEDLKARKDAKNAKNAASR